MSKAWELFREKLQTRAYEDCIPLSGQFELTSRCNLQCKMCYVCEPATDRNVMAGELTAGEWIRLAGEARDAGMLYVLLTGGEVFLRADFREIYEELSSMGFRITIYTNGTLITQETARWLGRIRPASIDITLYGASPETYSRVTGHADAFEHTMRGIDLLSYEGLDVQLRTTVIHDNADDLERLVELAYSRDKILKYGFCILSRRGDYSGLCDNIRLAPFEIAQYQKRAGMFYLEKLKELRLKLGIPDSLNITDEITARHNKDNKYAFRCAAGRTDFWITWDGRMTPCGIMDEPVTRPLEAGFKKAWDDMVKLCSSIPSCSECVKCDCRDVCWACPGRLKSETGEYDKPAPYFCEWAKYRKDYLAGGEKYEGL